MISKVLINIKIILDEPEFVRSLNLINPKLPQIIHVHSLFRFHYTLF